MQEENPYQSPAETSFVKEPEDLQGLRIAPSSKRFVNLLLENVFFYMFSFLVGLVFGVIAVLLHTRPALEGPAGSLFGIGLLLIYYIGQEALWGRTLAKFITRTRVVNERGGMPGLGQIVTRTLCRLIPFEPFSFLFGGNRPVGWHDSLSHARVVTN